MPQTSKVILLTIIGWLAGSSFYCYYWVTSILARPDTYGYEQWVVFPLMGFGLIVVILAELILSAKKVL